MFNDDIVLNLYRLYQEQNGDLVCMEEFQDDMSRVLYISRLLRKFKNTSETNAKLLVNHVIILYNVFDNRLTPTLFEMINDDLHPQLRGLLIYFNRLPEQFQGAVDMNIIQCIEDSVNA